jgi:hypothetical protein
MNSLQILGALAMSSLAASAALAEPARTAVSRDQTPARNDLRRSANGETPSGLGDNRYK